MKLLLDIQSILLAKMMPDGVESESDSESKEEKKEYEWRQELLSQH